MIQPTIINSCPNVKTSHCDYPFAVNLDRCVGSFSTFKDLSDGVCVPNKRKYLNMLGFNVITEISGSKTLTKQVSSKLKCGIDGRKCNSNQKWNNHKCICECKNPKDYCVCKKDYIWNRATCGCENGKYLSSVTEDSVIACDETIDTTETILTKTVPRKSTSTSFKFLYTGFLLITIALLVAVSIYCYLRKCQRKQKYLLPHQDINSKLKEILYQ